MENRLKVSIVIPCKTIDAYTKECISKCLEIDYPDYEILVLPDYDEGVKALGESVRVIPTGCVKPTSKRFMAITASDGDVYAFIDSDAYPTRDWLKNALRHFSDPSVAAVAGPSLTPDDDDPMAKASGFVLSSPLGGGSESIRYRQPHSRIRYVSEAPTCNFIIRKLVLNVVRVYMSFLSMLLRVLEIWPGEEIVLCGVVTKDLKKRIVYDPQVVVYHHRRPLFAPHIRQIWGYGLAKGFLLKFFRSYVRLRFLAPSLLVVGIISGLFFAMVNPIIKHIYIILISAYLLLSLFNSVLIGMKQRSAKMALLTFVGIIATHMCYGLAFIKGMLSRKL